MKLEELLNVRGTLIQMTNYKYNPIVQKKKDWSRYIIVVIVMLIAVILLMKMIGRKRHVTNIYNVYDQRSVPGGEVS